MNEQEQNFEKLKDFFKKDMNIKTALMQIAPREEDDYNEESRMKYIDKLYKELNYFEQQFKSIVESFGFRPEILEVISKHFENARKAFFIDHYDKGRINSIYQQVFSNMDESFIEETKQEFVGYTMFGENLLKVVDDTKTVNELLHAFHSYITNNEGIMRSMPAIESKINDFQYPITLYGDVTETAKKLFNDFPTDMDVGWTDIVSIENKILMMVRDRGHALTIEMDKEDKGAIFRYFIPKLCNRSMIEKLPGINKITENGATGAFEASDEEISRKLFDFIGSVPMDYDIVYDWDEVTSTIPKEPVIEEEQATFSESQAKDLTLERRTSGIKRIQEILQKAKNFILGKFTKEKGDTDNDKSIGDK